ncbi:MAG TPA: phosphate ABC transporter substrate-binding protein [Armatimonadota bacterium]|nr:phosphate ABC transporter substrate-binding protein [Armatimonadota bacterium]HQK92832.1 phosphate ABC transporter substrate-binding protein [Armatimonadota bacterium]
MSKGLGHSTRAVSASWLAAAIVVAMALAGCGGRGGRRALVLAGSTSVQPVAELIAEHYEVEHPHHSVNVQGGGSTAGVRAALEGAADIGMSSRALKPDEVGLEPIVVARDAVVLIVHPSNRTTDLTPEQVRAIYTGRITHWSDVTGPKWSSDDRRDDIITLVTREEGSGTRSAFEEGVMAKADITPRALVQDSTGTVRAIVASDPNAIGYISLGMVSSEVRALTYGGVQATEETVEEGTYALARPFLLLTRGAPSGEAGQFIRFALSDEGQQLVVRAGYLPVRRLDP